MILVPDELLKLWGEVTDGSRSEQDFARQQEQLLKGYCLRWSSALLRNGETDLRTSLLHEIADYYKIPEVSEVERRCRNAVGTLRREWEEGVRSPDRATVESFYESPATVYDLMEWHSLLEDNGALAYVLGLDIAQSYDVGSCLDFGSGVGSGALLLICSGIEMTLADISTTLLKFARWRINTRGLQAHFVDLKEKPLPTAEFDMILAMDVFEHLVDPVKTVNQLWKALKPGGLLFARIHADDDPDRPQHIVRDFGPTFNRMAELGLAEKWSDRWLWGHKLFQKR